MNARWLLQLDDEDEGNREVREQVRERLREALMEAEPREAVRAALAALRLGRHRLCRTLERILMQAALENEAIWWELYEALPTCRRKTLVLGKRLIEGYFQEQSPQRRVELLLEALERQSSAPLLGYSQYQEGVAVRIALVLSLARACAQTSPCIELRTLLEPLKRFSPTLTYNAPELANEALEVRALIESVTRPLKDLPLPAASAPSTIDLPLPATAQDTSGSKTEKEEMTLWNWLKSKFGS
jgi:hypothetical protein